MRQIIMNPLDFLSTEKNITPILPDFNNLFQKTCLIFMASLWNGQRVTNHLKKIIFEENVTGTSTIIEVENLVYNIISKDILLPEEVKLNLVQSIQPMGKQIFQFICITKGCFQMHTKLGVNLIFVWSDRCILNVERTAETIIHRNSCYPAFCFKLACQFCLENILFHFPSTLIMELQSDTIFMFSYHPQSITNFWIERLHKMRTTEKTLLDIFSDLTIEQILCFKSEMNIISIKYFVEKLNERQKTGTVDGLFYYFVKRRNEGLIVQYLLLNFPSASALGYIQQMAFHVLCSFLDWPCINLFLPAVNQLWNSLSNAQYIFLTLEIAELIQDNDMTCEYKNLFFLFWQQTPSTFKEHLYLKCTSGTFLSRLLSLNNTDSVFEKILKDSTAENRKEMVFYFEGMNLCDYLMKKGKLESLKIFVLNCIQNKETLIDFSTLYEAYKPSYQDQEMVLRKKHFRETVTPWFES